MDTTIAHDANCVTECVARALEHIAKTCADRGCPMPAELVVWADNTVKEAKNSTFMTYLAWLTASHNMKCAGWMSLIVGHTHDVLGFPSLLLCSYPPTLPLA